MKFETNCVKILFRADVILFPDFYYTIRVPVYGVLPKNVFHLPSITIIDQLITRQSLILLT